MAWGRCWALIPVDSVVLAITARGSDRWLAPGIGFLRPANELFFL